MSATLSALAKRLRGSKPAAVEPDRHGIIDFAEGGDPDRVGLIDAAAGGWFRNDTGELIEGFSITAEDVVLDVGCGDGGNIYFAGQQGAHVAFVDMDAGRVAETERRARQSRARDVTPLVSTCDPIPLPDGFATVIICTEVIEHVPDAAAFVAELVRVGAPGARYMVSVPDPVMESLQKKLAPPAYFEVPNHVRVLQRPEFAQLLTDGGLVIERTHTYGFFWAMWWAMFWSCNIDLGQRHPALDLWSQTWIRVLETKDGAKIKRTLDDFAPKSQLILARKPAP